MATQSKHQAAKQPTLTPEKREAKRPTLTPEKREAKRREQADKFIQLATRRVNIVLDGIVRLGKLSNRGSYVYTPEHVTAIFSTIRKAVDAAEARFSEQKAGRETFSL